MKRAMLLAGLMGIGCGTQPPVAFEGNIEVTKAEIWEVAPANERIRWHDSLDAAKAASRTDGKPVMVFFEFDA